MTYEEIVEFMKKTVKKDVTKTIKEHVAVEFDIYGEGEGAFYVEINSGVPAVEPYEYYDRDVKVFVTGDELVKLVKGEKTAGESMDDGILMLEGDRSAADGFFALFEKKKKAAKEKKAPAKKSAKKTAKAAEKSKAKKDVKVEKTIVKMAKDAEKPVQKDIKK